jgi:hypothetical protein
MKTLLLATAIAMGGLPVAAQAQDSSAKASPCSVVQKGAGPDSSATASAGSTSGTASAGGLSTSVTAGGGQVSASTTTSGGTASSSTDVGRTRVTVQPGSSVTVHSGGDGSSTAAVASNGQVTVLSSGNGCVVTIEPKG